jgi:hypothetical protein
MGISEPKEHEFLPSAMSERSYRDLVLAIQNAMALAPVEQISFLRHQASDRAGRECDFEEVEKHLELLKDSVAFSLLADLLEQGWSLRCDGKKVYVRASSFKPNPGETIDHVKQRIRKGLQSASNRQLASSSVSEFIASMERVRIFHGRDVSVSSLVDSGQELAKKIDAIRKNPLGRQEAALMALVKPSIQECTSDGRCETTGLKLQDIWRYFRHTWSLEYNPLPGRTQRFLIRNIARPNHPVIGIAMLASPTANLGSRDEWIGWQIEKVEEGLINGTLEASCVARALVDAIKQSVSDIRHDDLVTPSEIMKPTRQTIFKIEQIAARAEAGRRYDLVAHDNTKLVDIRSVKNSTIDDGVWFELSSTSLFVKKRAEQLAPLLQAYLTLEEHDLLREPVAGLYRAMVSKDGRAAIKVALNEIKKRRLSAEVADLAVCGAVAPYNELLGGKLVTLLMASKEVREMYANRYSGQVSEISSQIAGRPVIKDPTLRVITTTSLYGAASSQYNRLKLRKEDSPSLPKTLQWVELRDGEGVSVTHISEITVGLMRRLGEAHHGRRRINSVFGEGSSPRMRQIREGLNILGINDDSLLKQHLGRKVYGCELYEGAREDLLGFEKRKSRQLVPSASAIARGWIARWLSMRIQNVSVLDRLRALDRNCVAKKLAFRAEETRYIEAISQPSEKVARTRSSTSSTASISKSSASASVSRDLS